MKKKVYDCKTMWIQAFLILVLCTESIGSTNVAYAKESVEQQIESASEEETDTVVSGGAIVTTSSACTAEPEMGQSPSKEPVATPALTSIPVQVTSTPIIKPTSAVTDLLPTDAPTIIASKEPLPVVTAKPDENEKFPTQTPSATSSSITEPVKTPPSIDLTGATATPKPSSSDTVKPTEKPSATEKPNVTEKPSDTTGSSNTNKVCTIAYVLNGGKNNGQNPTRVYKNSAVISLSDAKKKGYYFQGWYTDSLCKNRIYTVGNTDADKVILYAKWKKVIVDRAQISNVKVLKNGHIKVTVKKWSMVKGYEFMYANNPAFANKYRVCTVKNPKELSILQRGVTYYIKVRAYKVDSWGRKIYGSYSKVTKCK